MSRRVFHRLRREWVEGRAPSDLPEALIEPERRTRITSAPVSIRKWEIDETTATILLERAQSSSPGVFVSSESETRIISYAKALAEAMEARGDALISLFARPASDLREHHPPERWPLQKARRVHPKAENLAARRTDDWLGVTREGVALRRVAVRTSDPSLDTYENSVSRAVIADFKRDILPADALIEQERRLADSHDAPIQHYRPLERTKALRSEDQGTHLADEAENRETARVTIEKAVHLIDTLQRSRLGRLKSPRDRTSVGKRLRPTNRFRFGLYHHIARLHLERERIRAAQVGSEPEAEWSQVHKAFRDFAEEVLWRAAREYTECDAWGTVSIQSISPDDLPTDDADGAWDVAIDSTPRLRVISMPISLGALSSESDARLALVELDRIAASASHAASAPGLYPVPDVAVLIAGGIQDVLPAFHSADDQVEAGLMNLLEPTCEPRTVNSHLPRVWMIPISPLDITSVERLARCVSWTVIGSAFIAEADKQVDGVFPRAASNLLKLEDHAALETKPNGSEVLIRMRSRLAKNDIDDLRKSVLDREERRVRALASDHPEKSAGETTLNHAKALLDWLEVGGSLAPLETCPQCKQRGIVTRWGASEGFRAECTDSHGRRGCNLAWGLRASDASGPGTPFILPLDGLERFPDKDRRNERFVWLGRYQLAAACLHPFRDRDDPVTLISPASGACSRQERAGCPRCDRMTLSALPE